MTSLTVSIVLYNSGADVAACLRALRAQTRSPDAIVVLDNASHDDGLAVAQRIEPGITPIRSSVNLGFAGGHNSAMRAAPADIHMVLNADCRLAPSFLARALRVLEADPTAGSVTGRLLGSEMTMVTGARSKSWRMISSTPPE